MKRLLMTQAAFARAQGCSKGWVTALKQAGRLVMDKRGKRELVDVAASLELIAATENLTREDVAARHEAERGGEDVPKAPAEVAAQHSYQEARAKKEHYLAEQAKHEHLKQIGAHVASADVERGGMDAGTAFRAAMENLPNQISAELAGESDAERCAAMLREHIEYALKELERNLKGLVEVKG